MPTDTGRIEITLETPRITLIAGESAEQTIVITNKTAFPDNFDLSVIGLPTNWCSFSKPSVNLFPNWKEEATFTISLSAKVKPDLYRGNIVATARTQPANRIEVAVTIEVLAPLKMAARLQPHRVTGFKANYNLVLRNRSMSEAVMNLRLNNEENPYCEGRFNPPQARVAAGQSQTVELKVTLDKKTPRDQKEQAQAFEVLIYPQWLVNGQYVPTPTESVDGEYVYRSRWNFIARHPWLFINITVLLILAILWQVFILQTIQSSLLTVATFNVNYPSPTRNSWRVEQQVLTDSIQKTYNPLGAISEIQVRFKEQDQKVEASLKLFGLGDGAKMVGRLRVDPATGRLAFVADPGYNPEGFPWTFVPPNKLVERLDGKLRQVLRPLSQRMQEVRIEGTTLFIITRACNPGELCST